MMLVRTPVSDSPRPLFYYCLEHAANNTHNSFWGYVKFVHLDLPHHSLPPASKPSSSTGITSAAFQNTQGRRIHQRLR